MNTIHRRRLYFLGFFCVVMTLAVFLVMQALKENINLYYTPTEMVEKQIEKNKYQQRLRVGGLVQKGSIVQKGLSTQFVITDFHHSIQAHYTGILPDLFKEGQGVIAGGNMENGVLEANEVLAKHDENYQPPKVLNHAS
jgi:cytochrome c-type biogenesis protein CcmE